MEISFYQGCQLEQVAALSDIPTLRASDGSLLAGSFVDVPAKEIKRLLAIDELADCLASEVLSFARAIERCALRRRMANQDQRIEAREFVEALS
jgi:hypothetical protein